MLPKSPVVVSARAPYPFPWGGFYWYEPGQEGVPLQGLDESLDQIRELVGSLPASYQVDPKRVFPLGFSQGALMSAHLTLASPDIVAGTVMLSGYVREPRVDGTLAGKPLFMAHGTEDQTLPIVMARQARVYLEGLQLDVEYHEYPMAHEVVPAELEDLVRWFEARGIS